MLYVGVRGWNHKYGVSAEKCSKGLQASRPRPALQLLRGFVGTASQRLWRLAMHPFPLK